VLDALEATGGIYVAIFVVAVISGVFPLVNSELALTGIALAGASTPRLLVLAAIIAVGQTITHSTLYLSGREVAQRGAARRATLQARIERGRALVARWGDRSLLVLFSASTLGLPPMMLVALVSGALGIRFRSFVVIGLVGRVLRFAAIAIAASLV
jgi:membrane protein YqaA with SNARE-associated domain